MKSVFAIAVSTIILSACNGAPQNEKILTGLCQDIFAGDDQIVRMLASDASTDLDSFCNCYAATIAADAVKLPLHKDVVMAIAEARKSAGGGAEDAAGKVEEMIQSGEIDTFTEEQLDSTGDDFQLIAEAMNENGGSCPSPN
jgi:hypothetical protein